MKQRTRIYYTETQRALMWERWRAGDTLHAIAKLFDRNHTSVQQIFARTGGIRPPSRVLVDSSPGIGGARGDLAGRDRWVAWLDARSLRRSPSTVSRETPQRRPLQLSREHGGARRVGSGAASEAL